MLSSRNSSRLETGMAEPAPGDRQPKVLKMCDKTRNMLVAVLGEFVGTFLFLFFAF